MPQKTLKTIYLSLFIFFTAGLSAFSQNSIDETLTKYNSGSIPYVQVVELKDELKNSDSLVLLDTRSFEEFDVSHLKDAIWVGYKEFNDKKVKSINKNSNIIVYCSVGVRSEKIGEELRNLGFKNIRNLYGGIFLWVNKNNPVFKNNTLTENIHTYNSRWEEYITNGIKVN